VDEIWNISDGPRCALTQEKWRKSPQGFRPRVPKSVLFFVISGTQCNAAFQPHPAPISNHFFKTTDVNRFLLAYIGEKFSTFCAGGFPGPKNCPKYGILLYGVCDTSAAQMAHFVGDRNHFGG